MRVLRIAIFTLAVLIGYAAAAQSPVKTPEPAAMKAEPAFVKAYEQMKVLDGLIADTEKELSAYRQRQQLKITELRQWMKEHAVEGFAYDAEKKEFVPPPAKLAQPAKKP